MRLLKCHIENFGKFADYTVDFAENPFVCSAPNGWGKSTLAAFIKVMFFGFANEKKRGDTLERERVRYKPWQGGVYGGELVFEAGGKSYVLNRTFGKKESEDTFALYDAATNLPSGDFTANIGEELFQINQESFLRTVFIGQNDCGTAATDSINAKIGNLADSLDDMNNYEAVQQVIKNLRNNLTPNRKTGALRQLKEEMAQLRDELRRTASVEQAVSELEERLAGCAGERVGLLAERKTLQDKWELAAKQKAVEAKRTHYASILKQWEAKRDAASGLLSKLGGKAPERDGLQRMQKRRDELLQLESEICANALNPAEAETLARVRARFAEGVPDEDEIRRGQGIAVRLEELGKQSLQSRLSEEEAREYADLREHFAAFTERTEGEREAFVPDTDAELDEVIRQWNLYLDRKNGLGTKRATFRSLQMIEQTMRSGEPGHRGPGAAVWIGAAALCLLLAGGVLTGLYRATGGIWLLGAGAVAAVAAVVLSVRACGKRKAARAVRDESRRQEREGAGQLEREIAEDEALMERARACVEDFLLRCGRSLSEWGEDDRRVQDELYALKNDWRRLRRLEARERDYRSRGYEEQMRALREQAVEILTPFCEKNALAEERLADLFGVLERDRSDFVALGNREKHCAGAKEAAAELREELWQFLRDFGQGEASDLDEGLRQIACILTEYENDSLDLDRLRSEREAFEASYDIRNFEGQQAETAEPEEELKHRMEQADERAAELLEHMHSYQAQLDERQQELDELQTLRERLNALEQVYERKEAYYMNLGLTGEYLEKAKESLSAKYIGPVLDSFRRNYALISGESADAFRMDANIRVTRREQGEQREIKAFSSGSQDLINIVLRVALVDAMYEREKPFLIMDDSFVNLDDERLETARGFLHGIAEEYQVLYFTCHGSRAL